ncbi:MAG: rhodanese-like domain-containing protein [Candidatus Saccharimonadales bacterium]
MIKPDKAARLIVDVREPDEFEARHVAGSVNIPLGAIEEGAEMLEGLASSAPIVVYCQSGSRAAAAQQRLRALGYSNVTNGINQQQVESSIRSTN